MGSLSQGVLPFQYQQESQGRGLTALAGLPMYLELAAAAGLERPIGRHVGLRTGAQGWTDSQVVMALLLLNLAGGDCVDDLRVLEADQGFARLLKRVELWGLPRRQRRALERRWRKARTRTVPSPSAVFRYLARFRDTEQEAQRGMGQAFIPTPTQALRGLARVNADLVGFVQRRAPESVATLDMDATLVATQKREALHCYQHYAAYQPLNLWWAEQEMVLSSEFRDGNVPAHYELKRCLKEALAQLPESVERVQLRSDAAGYQHDLLRWCEEGHDTGAGRVQFAITCYVSQEFLRAVAAVPESAWQALPEDDSRQWAEVCFVPNEIARKKHGCEYRYLAVREALRQRQLELPNCDGQLALPGCPTLKIEHERYKISGLVTNLEGPGEAVIAWLDQRCGKSEHAHGEMKSELAGGQFPSGHFYDNAAWWAIMILALNLNAAMKRLVLGGSWGARRMKAIRFHLIAVPGRLIVHGRRLRLQISRGHPALALLLQARRTIRSLLPAPAT